MTDNHWSYTRTGFVASPFSSTGLGASHKLIKPALPVAERQSRTLQPHSLKSSGTEGGPRRRRRNARWERIAKCYLQRKARPVSGQIRARWALDGIDVQASPDLDGEGAAAVLMRLAEHRAPRAAARSSVRAWTTTSWPLSTMACAAARSNPVVEPVMDTRRLIGSARQPRRRRRSKVGTCGSLSDRCDWRKGHRPVIPSRCSG